MLEKRIPFPMYLALVATLNALVVFLLYEPLFPIHDVADTLYNAKSITAGKVPYRDFFHNHFVGYMIPFALLELLVGISPASVAVMQWLFQTLYCIALALTTRELLNSENAAKWTALITSTVGWFPDNFGHLFHIQSYLLPLIATVLFLVVRASQRIDARSLFGASLTFSLLATFDQRVIFFAPLVFLPFAFKKEYRSARIFFVVCALASLLPSLGLVLLAYHGALQQFLFQTILYQFEHRNGGIDNPIGSSARLFGRQYFLDPVGSLALLGSLLTLRRSPGSITSAVCVILFIAGWLAALAGGRPFFNYLLFLSPFLCMGTACLVFMAPTVNARFNAVAVSLVTLLCMAHIWALYPLISRPTDNAPHRHADLGRAVRQLAPQSSDILVWGYCPQLYLYAERYSAFGDVGLLTIGSSLFHLSPVSSKNIVGGQVDSFKHFLETHRPSVVIAPVSGSSGETFLPDGGCIFASPHSERAAGFHFFRSWLEANYQQHAAHKARGFDLGVYVPR